MAGGEEGRDVTDAELLKDIDAQRLLMIRVSTGGPAISTVNDEYVDRRERISVALRARGLDDPNEFSDLWMWYGKWSSGDLPRYQDRREYITGMYAPLMEAVKRQPTSAGARMFEEPTGWEKVDRGLIEIKKRIAQAATEEQFQAVGLLCREVLISLAQLVYDPGRHPSSDGVPPSPTDAKRQLDAYFAVELSGSTNEAARRHARASLDLANDLQHRRTAAFREAALCAEATTSVVNIVAIISGRRKS